MLDPWATRKTLGTRSPAPTDCPLKPKTRKISHPKGFSNRVCLKSPRQRKEHGGFGVRPLRGALDASLLSGSMFVKGISKCRRYLVGSHIAVATSLRDRIASRGDTPLRAYLSLPVQDDTIQSAA